MAVNDRGAPTAPTHDIMMIQESMKVAGYYRGTIDGLAGSLTFAAVRAYKKQNHMPVNNRLTDEFIEHLREHA
ncbi:peptidoglycan-binding domain-containing protein [Granulosicoccus sp. 3-233]|uniref:peptidoglycan-binding domain-containing protein n=1 Tax=Granulosicoccus sp. 3-233 TaxID=3417969 RepID=UPI003D356F1F